MHRDDLYRLLDLDGHEPVPPTTDPLAAACPAPTPSPRSLHPTAFALDEWALRRGRDLLTASERLQNLACDAQAAADFHAAAFEPEPVLQDGCVDLRRWQFLQELLGTPEYHALHASTLLDPAASALAAEAFAAQFQPLTDKAAEPSAAGEMATLRAVGQAVTQAAADVAECRETALAAGMGPGHPGGNDPQAIAALFRRVRHSATLRQIVALAGRFRRTAQAQQRQKTTHGLDDLIGVVLDGELGRLLPHELAKVVLPEFADDLLRRLVERQAMCWQRRGTEPAAQGPILVVLDESGSMQGARAHTAKALALALVWIARQQRRWCALIAYSGNTGERLLPLPPGRGDETALLDWLEAFLGGGSDRDVPIAELPGYYARLGAPHGRTDLICITDARCRIPSEMQTTFLAWKQQVQARLITLVLDHDPGDLAPLSEEVHRLASLDVTEPAVARVLSL